MIKLVLSSPNISRVDLSNNLTFTLLLNLIFLLDLVLDLVLDDGGDDVDDVFVSALIIFTEPARKNGSTLVVVVAVTELIAVLCLVAAS